MRKITKKILSYFIGNKVKTEDLDRSIQGFLQNYNHHAAEKAPSKRYSHNIASHIHQVLDCGKAIISDDYIDTCEFLISSINGRTIDSMSKDQQTTTCEQIRIKAQSSPIIAGSQFLVSSFSHAIWVEWSLPIPIKTMGFTEQEKKKLDENILSFFKTYFNVQMCSVKTYPVFDLEEFAEVHKSDVLYDNILFPKIFFETFGLSNEFKFVQPKLAADPSVTKILSKGKIIPFRMQQAR